MLTHESLIEMKLSRQTLAPDYHALWMYITLFVITWTWSTKPINTLEIVRRTSMDISERGIRS